LIVKDNGIGIPDEDKEHLFSTFFRSKNAVNIQGTGLGLHIVKRYLDLMGGNINIESELNKGTTVIINLTRKPN
jgi:signal transduction histidine kinase